MGKRQLQQIAAVSSKHTARSACEVTTLRRNTNLFIIIIKFLPHSELLQMQALVFLVTIFQLQQSANKGKNQVSHTAVWS